MALAEPARSLSVEEYFSYGCIHCKNFDPTLEDWLTTLPEDVQFQRTPTAFSRAWGVLAQAYYALEKADALEGNHEQLFKGIHNGGRMFSNGEAIADYLDSDELPAAEFMRAFNSRDVARRLNRAEQATRRVGIRAVPTLVVAGKYRVGMVNGERRALEVVDYLLEQERALIGKASSRKPSNLKAGLGGNAELTRRTKLGPAGAGIAISRVIGKGETAKEVILVC